MNDELAIRVLAHIEEDPSSWDQTQWLLETDCGTSGCFAGWTTVLSGWKRLPSSAAVDPESGGVGYDKVEKGGRRLPVWEAAAEELGEDAYALGYVGTDFGTLFYFRNPLDTLYAHVAELSGMDVEVVYDKVADERRRLREVAST